MAVFRTLLPSEAWRYEAHLHRLDADDRRARFMATLAGEAVSGHVRRIDWTRTVVAVAIVRGEVRAAAELRRDERHGGELAVSVERAWQNQGLGTALTRRILTAARNRRVRGLMMYCLPDNRRMQAIARKLMGPCVFDGGEVTSTVTLSAPNSLSLAQEALDYSVVAFNAVLDQWQGGRRPDGPARAA